MQRIDVSEHKDRICSKLNKEIISKNKWSGMQRDVLEKKDREESCTKMI
jgi:hypothetical protein